MVAQVGPGGHHFGTQHTIERYRDAFHKTPIANRFGYDAWEQRGAEDTYQRANKLWRDRELRVDGETAGWAAFGRERVFNNPDF